MFDKDQKKQLRIKLAALMDEHEGQWPGHPYVDDDGTFGVRAGQLNGGLYAAYFLIDKLAEAGLFKGAQNPRADLDTAVYEMGGDMTFNVYDEAALFRNGNNEIQVRITTDKSLGDIVAAIDHGIASAQGEKNKRAQAKRAYEDQGKADKRRDRMPTIFSPETDLAFASEYLRMRLEEEVPSSDIDIRQDRLDADLARALNDDRPRLKATYELAPESGFGPVNRFNNEILRSVFRGRLAVSFNMTAQKDERMDVSVAGTPARLTADILDHDLEGARRVHARMSEWLPPDMRKKMADEIDRRYSLQVAESLKDNLHNKGLRPQRPATFNNLK